MSQSIADIRQDYSLHSLDQKDVSENPIDQFTLWWDEAIKSEITEVNAMTLATVTADGHPSARIVLLKGYDKDGFVFFTNYASNKGAEIEANPYASLVFFWKELERQVRIDGLIEKISAAESEEYFQSRPEGSRIGAWASPQSTVIASREVIEKNVADLTQKYASGIIPRPEHWGGYRVRPVAIEFWQGRSSRLHDRIKYRLEAQEWIIERLAP